MKTDAFLKLESAGFSHRPWLEGPDRLVDWWDMLKFSAEKFVNIGLSLAWFKDTHAKKIFAKLPISDQDLAFFQGFFQSLSHDLEQIGCEISAKLANDLSYDIHVIKTAEAFSAKAEMFSHAVHIEMQKHLFLWVPKERAEYYGRRASDILNENCINRFSSVIKDVESGMQCYATEQYTACAFHLTRACEAPVRALAKCLSLPIGNNNWGQVFNHFQQSIDKHRPCKPSGPPWDTHGDFLVILNADFRAANKAWRNGTMHLDSDYDQDEALYFIGVIPRFLNSAAEKMDQDGKLY